MKSKNRKDALVEEDKTNVMNLHGQNREGTKRFPVLVGDLEALRSGLRRRPAPVRREVGLQDSEASWKPLAKGTSMFTGPWIL